MLIGVICLIIDLLTSFSKLLELVMQARILKQLTKYNILSIEQYGFRIGLKIGNAVYKLITEILNIVNKKLLVGGIFCNMEEVFVLIMVSYYLN